MLTSELQVWLTLKQWCSSASDWTIASSEVSVCEENKQETRTSPGSRAEGTRPEALACSRPGSNRSRVTVTPSSSGQQQHTHNSKYECMFNRILLLCEGDEGDKGELWPASTDTDPRKKQWRRGLLLWRAWRWARRRAFSNSTNRGFLQNTRTLSLLRAGVCVCVSVFMCLPVQAEVEAELLSCRAAVPQSWSRSGETQRSERVHWASEKTQTIKRC